MVKVIEGVFIGNLEWKMVYIGVGIVIVFIIVDEIFVMKKVKFRIFVMFVVVGIYLLFSFGVLIFIGGLIRYFVSKVKGNGGEDMIDVGVFGVVGLIVGEVLMGIIFVVFIVVNVVLSVGFISNVFGVFFLVGIVIWFYMMGKKK